MRNGNINKKITKEITKNKKKRSFTQNDPKIKDALKHIFDGVRKVVFPLTITYASGPHSHKFIYESRGDLLDTNDDSDYAGDLSPTYEPTKKSYEDISSTEDESEKIVEETVESNYETSEDESENSRTRHAEEPKTPDQKKEKSNVPPKRRSRRIKRHESTRSKGDDKPNPIAKVLSFGDDGPADITIPLDKKDVSPLEINPSQVVMDDHSF